jgi:hypothetical protein
MHTRRRLSESSPTLTRVPSTCRPSRSKNRSKESSCRIRESHGNRQSSRRLSREPNDSHQFRAWTSIADHADIQTHASHDREGASHRVVNPTSVVAKSATAELGQEQHVRGEALRVEEGRPQLGGGRSMVTNLLSILEFAMHTSPMPCSAWPNASFPTSKSVTARVGNSSDDSVTILSAPDRRNATDKASTNAGQKVPLNASHRRNRSDKKQLVR